jgi:hypothetical protein
MGWREGRCTLIEGGRHDFEGACVARCRFGSRFNIVVVGDGNTRDLGGCRRQKNLLEHWERKFLHCRGEYSSPAIGDGTWSMTAHGVELHTPALSAILDIDKLPDGTFKSKLENAAGKYCE